MAAALLLKRDDPLLPGRFYIDFIALTIAMLTAGSVIVPDLLGVTLINLPFNVFHYSPGSWLQSILAQQNPCPCRVDRYEDKGSFLVNRFFLSSLRIYSFAFLSFPSPPIAPDRFRNLASTMTARTARSISVMT